MILNSPNYDKFRRFFEANKKLLAATSAMNKTTNELMRKKFYSFETGKVWQVINAYEKGNFLSRSYTVWIEDLSIDFKFWTWERLKYGWKHPRMMIPVEVLEEKFKKGILKAIDYEWEVEELLKKDNKDA